MDYPEDARASRYGEDRPDPQELAEYARHLRASRAERARLPASANDDPWQTTHAAR